MPQPIRKKCSVKFVGLSARPQHAAKLGEIVAVSGALESRLGWLLAFLSGGSASVTIPMFLSVASTEAQRSMLMAAAEQKLQGAMLDEFKDLMSEFRVRYGERNRLVHNLWGISEEHPDKAIWAAAKDIATGMMPIATAASKEQRNAHARVELDSMYKRCSLYSVGDLEQTRTRLDAFAERVGEMLVRLMKEGFDEPEPDKLS